MMRIIVVTEPDFIPGEAKAIARMLESGLVHRVHLRKPGCNAEDLSRLIEEIPCRLWPGLSLHDCPELSGRYGCGVHVNSRTPAGMSFGASVMSRSCHSLGEAAASEGFDYVFLSPVYPSISKPGYVPQFTLDSLRGKVTDRMAALGGVTPERLHELASTGFGGAAMLGCAWNMVKEGKTEELLSQLKCYNI